MRHALSHMLGRWAFQKAQNRGQPFSLTCLNIVRCQLSSLQCCEALFAGATRPHAHSNPSAFQLSQQLSSIRQAHALNSSISYLLRVAAPRLVKYGLQACPLR
jgi:hypothetical protein